MQSGPLQIVEFDFDSRQDRQITADDVHDSLASGMCLWADVDLGGVQDAEETLKQLKINPLVIESILTQEATGRYSTYDDCIHVFVTSPTLSGDSLSFVRVDMVFADRMVITIHKGQVDCLAKTRQMYRKFFQAFAQSLGFLVFEFWDGLIDSYREAYLALEEDVEGVRESIFKGLDDGIFSRVSDITCDLLKLRRSVIADRESLQQLSIHKSEFVSETTQPYLARMVGTLERLGSDVSIGREILSESLSLYLGIVTHRTNRIVNRLTVISVIFLPLTFLVGLYGMNFEHQPEFSWEWGYPFFWVLAFIIFVTSVVFIRIKHWF